MTEKAPLLCRARRLPLHTSIRPDLLFHQNGGHQLFQSEISRVYNETQVHGLKVAVFLFRGPSGIAQLASLFLHLPGSSITSSSVVLTFATVGLTPQKFPASHLYNCALFQDSSNIMVNYYDDMASVKQMCQTCSLLFRWQGSIYKILWRQVLMYFVTYIALGLMYKLALNEEDQRTFEKIALCCAKYADSIPVVLFLGFFTGTVMQRWWAVYAAIPGTGKIITLATFYMQKNNPQTSKWLRTLTRYLILAWMLTMRTTCRPLRNKYPSLESMQRAGFLLKHEAEILALDEEKNHKWSLRVVNWALILVRQARDEGYFDNPSDATRLLDPIVAFKKSCSIVLKYQITAIPLSFVQAVTLTVQIFGLVSLMGKQFVDFPTKLLVIDCYLPILPAMQYLAYLSWLKLGEVAVNPFGEDDDDFDIIGLFENHVELAGDLLKLFELDQNNPVKESLEQMNFTLFKLDEKMDQKPEIPSEALSTSEEIPFMDDADELEVMINS